MAKSRNAVRFPDGETYVYDAIWDRALDAGEAELIKGKEGEKALKDYQRAELLKLIKPGDTLTAVCTHYSRSSGTARYRVFIPALSPEGRVYIRNVTRDIAAVAGFKLSKYGEITMGGYGYSKSFQIGYSLGRSLWPNGTVEPHGTRNGQPDHDGGYAINVMGA